MSQGSKSGLRVFEDFLFVVDTVNEAIADAAAETIVGSHGIVVSGTGTALSVTSPTDEPGGVIELDSDDDTADEGGVMFSTYFRPADGAIRFEARIKAIDLSETGIFVGFQETFTENEFVMPATIATTTITIVNTGQTVGLVLDHNATNEDFYFFASNDASVANGVDLTDPAINKGWGVGAGGGGRSGSDFSGTNADDEWLLFVIEIDTDGTGRAYFGSSQNDVNGVGPRLIGQTDRGALDPTALYWPVVAFENDTTSAQQLDVDYYLAEGARDWSV